MYKGGGAFCTVTPYLSIEFAENWGCYFRYVTKTKYLLKSNSKRSYKCKKSLTCHQWPSAPLMALTFQCLDNIITSTYHNKFHQILLTNKAVNQKGL